MGLVPIQVYLDGDVPWMPYQTLLQNVSFVTDLQGLPALMEHLATIPDREIEAMEARIQEMIPQYFTFEGVLEQIQAFMLSPERAALECQGLTPHSGSAKSKAFP